MTYKELIAKMESLIAEEETAAKKYEAAESDEDKAKWKDTLTDLRAEADKIEESLSIAKTAADRRARLAEVKEEASLSAAPDLSRRDDDDDILRGKRMDEARTQATAKNHEQENIDHEKMFTRFTAGKGLSDGERDFLLPKTTAFHQGAGGVRAPRVVAQAITGMQNKASLLAELRSKVMLSSNAADASLVPEEFMAEVLKLQQEPAFLFQRVRRVPTQHGTLTWPRLVQTDADEFGGVAVNWTAEGATKTEAEPVFEQITISANELSAQTQVSRTLLGRSAIDLEAFLQEEFRTAIFSTVDEAILNGTGTGQPLGVIQDGDVREVARATVGTVDYDDLVDMETVLRSNHRVNATWVIADGVDTVLKKTLDSDGRPLYQRSVADSRFGTILGHPVLTTHRTTLGAAGDVIFGDWSKYISPVEQEVVFQRSEHRHMEQGLILFVVFILVGGRAALPRAIARLKAVTS